MIKKETTKQYVVQTYTQWTEPQYETTICTLAQLTELQKQVGEVEAIYELGKEVKLQPALV